MLCGFFGISQFLERKENGTKNPRVCIVNDSEGPVPSEDFLRSKQEGRPQGECGSPGHMKEKPGAEAVGYLKTDTALPPTPQGISYAPKGKVANGNPSVPAAATADPGHTAGHSPGAPVGLAHPPFAQRRRTRRPWAVSAAVALLRGKARSQDLSLDALKQAKLPHTDIPSAARGMSPGLMPAIPARPALLPDGRRRSRKSVSPPQRCASPCAAGYSASRLSPWNEKGKPLDISMQGANPKMRCSSTSVSVGAGSLPHLCQPSQPITKSGFWHLGRTLSIVPK
ncbi:Sal-like protein 4 [Plecturocebus cupreus]